MAKTKNASKISTRIFLYLLLFVLLIILTGCSKVKPPTPHEVKTQKELGGIHVTLFPLVEFETYRNQLSPKFTLTGDAALNVVAPYTSSRSYSKFSGMSGSASLGFPTTSGTETITKSTTDGMTTETTEDVETKSFGTVSGSSEGREPTERVLSPDSQGAALSRLDPMTQYWTAAALYQEVQLLNRYISDLNHDDEYQAYVVRLQISQIPYIRRAPYDSFVDLSFFLEDKEESAKAKDLPIVLPMLVTDNLESSLGSYHSETVRSLSLALQGMAGQVGFNLGGKTYSQLVTEILGRDINSLFTVGRLHNNILRVRIGAMQQANDLYAVVPHTQTVSVLVLAKKKAINDDSTDLVVTSQTEWKHALDPKKNPTPSERSMEKYLDGFNVFLKDIGAISLVIQEFRGLVTAYSDSDFELFTELFDKSQEKKGINCKDSKKLVRTLPPSPSVKVIWGFLASTFAESSFDRTSVSIPPWFKDPPVEKGYEIDNKTPIYLFDNKKFISVTIPQIGRTNPSRIYGKSEFCYDTEVKNNIKEGDGVGNSKCPEKNTFPLYSISTVADSSKRNIVLHFPSALKLKYNQLAPKKIVLFWVGDEKDDEFKTYTNLVLVSPSDEIKLESKVIITDNQKYIAINDKNQGQLRLFVEKIADSEKDLILAVSGARLDSVEGTVVKRDKNVLKIQGIGSFTIKLNNLIDGEELTLELKSKKRGLSTKLGTLKAKSK